MNIIKTEAEWSCTCVGMAFHDDVGVLLSYLRHSLVTNDDTGKTEVVYLSHVWVLWVHRYLSDT